MVSTDHVAAYYDDNTARFLRFGQGGKELAIHRAVWGPGVETSSQAHRFVNQAILDSLSAVPGAGTRICVLDIGCGVGGTLAYMADRTPGLRGVGLTVSGRQAEIGTAVLARRGLSDRVSIRRADACLPESYNGLPFERIQGAYAVESLLHIADVAPVFAALAGRMVPGGVFVVCDDLFVPEADGRRPASRRRYDRMVAEFRTGWHAYGLRTPDELDTIAKAHGFLPTESRSLTAFLDVGRPRDRVIAGFVPFVRLLRLGSPWAMNMLGGNALQYLLRTGGIDYRLVTYRFAG